jgi:tetratricopeptide (TPR) repeat protein
MEQRKIILDRFEQRRCITPNDPTVYIELGTALIALDRPQEALGRYQEASVLFPRSVAIQHAMGHLLEQMLRLDDAIICYRRATQIDPNADGSYSNMGNCLQALGHFDKAHLAYRQAIAIAPETTLYYRNLVQSDRLSVDDPCFVAMESLVTRLDTLTKENQYNLLFAYSQALMNLGHNAKAFEHVLVANKLHRELKPYDEAATLQRMNNLQNLITADVIKAHQGKGHQSIAPIFIVGMPRSSSTLIEQILSSHPDVIGLGERPSFEFAQREFDLSNITEESLVELGSSYLRRIQLADPNVRYSLHFTDKFLFNFINVGLIHMTFPNAKIIHCQRSTIDNCMSIFTRIFNDVPFSYDLGELGRYYRSYEQLMEHWRNVLPSGVMLDMQYEDLVNDFEPNVRRILDHCNLSWNDKCLEFHKTTRRVNTASVAQVRQPLFKSSIERWRPDDQVLKPLYDALGYDATGSNRKV